MNRCAPTTLRLALCLCALAASAPAPAQSSRPFPPTALRGELLITQPPDVRLNGQPARLAPGARIRGANNLLQMSGALVGQRLVVNYTREQLGLLLDVWVLTEAEATVQPWPTTEAQAQAWAFDAAAQTWTRR